jgi:hypothetical protein
MPLVWRTMDESLTWSISASDRDKFYLSRSHSRYPTTHNMQDSLRVIAELADELTRLTGPLLTSRSETIPQSAFAGLIHQPTTAPSLNSRSEAISAQLETPPLNLRYPPSLRPCLEALGVSGGVISELTHAFTQHAEDLRKISIIKFEESCRQLMSIPQSSSCLHLPDKIEKLRSLYQCSYEKLLRKWMDKLIPALLNEIAELTYRSDRVEMSAPGESKASKFNHVSFSSLPPLSKLTIFGI